MTLYETYFRQFTGVSTEEFNKIIEKFKQDGKSGKQMLLEYVKNNNVSDEQLTKAVAKLIFLMAIKEMEEKT